MIDPPVSTSAGGPSRAMALTGVAAALGGVLLASLCCLAPALIVALGIGSLYGALYGYRYVFGGVGAALIVGGLLWARRQRGSGACACEQEGESNG